MEQELRVCNRVRLARMNRGLSQSELARSLGVTRQTILGIERGKLNPTVALALNLARILGEPLDYLFYLGVAEEHGDLEGARTGDNEADDDSELNKGIWDFV